MAIDGQSGKTVRLVSHVLQLAGKETLYVDLALLLFASRSTHALKARRIFRLPLTMQRDRSR